MLGRVSPVTGIVLVVGFLTGCISPLDVLESDVEVERSLLSNWLPGGVEVPLSGSPVQTAASTQPAPVRDITVDTRQRCQDLVHRLRTVLRLRLETPCDHTLHRRVDIVRGG